MADWQVVKDSAGTIWLTKKGIAVPYGIQSIQVPGSSAAGGLPDGTALSNALHAIGANAAQQAGIIQSVDAGAIEQGGSKVGVPVGAKPGQTFPKLGGKRSGSEAVATGPSNPLDGLADSIDSIEDFFKYIAWLFHPLNWLRLVEFVLGWTLMAIGIAILASRRGGGAVGTTARAVVSRSPMGRSIRVMQGARMGRHEGQREAARMTARQQETREARESSALEREQINRRARQSAREE